MKFRVERDVLAESVAWAARSLPSRPSVPILAGLLVEAEDGQITLSGFDYETSVRVTVPAQVADPGKCLISGRLVADISKSLPNQPVDIAVDGAKVQVTCGSSRFTLQTLPTEEYPALPTLPAASGTVKADVFAQAVSQVVTAAGREDTLPVLTGVRVEIEGSTISLLATDRYRLAIRELEWNPESPDASAAALVPARVLSETAKAMTGSDVTVSLAAPGTGDGIVGFEGQVSGGNRRATTRLLDGEFPKVRGIIPNDASIATRVRIDTASLVEAVKRVALVAERNAPVRLTFEEDSVTLDAGSGDEAQASESLEARVVGDPVTVGFNPTYLLDGLGAIGTPVAHLAFTQATKPAELTGVRDFDGEPISEFRYVLMPVRLNS
ncbi:DNA polymerase-3 subunit beta [Kribbella aluminosa]|uniref:Beta sliding clamp n=1 Tax=Kribbella aluminosa TaxID=416017 RepID=A0ABS4UQJ5_9ACTN|nr:DNA polymerase III subunit beta [Kribbella aluminosa]MBP2353829.1 DNA polymerase-3 subunit beta [Kribbella aluminosa]